MTDRAHDVVIAGGGVMGSAIAYFLAAEPGFRGSVLVVERDPSYEFASTPRSSGGIRQQFSTPENIDMCLYSSRFIKAIDKHLTVDGEAPSVGFVEAGYLFLTDGRGEATMRASHAIQRGRGADIALLAPDQVKARFPWLAVDDLALGAFGESGEGWVDPFALLQAFRRKARSLGVIYVKDEVVGLERAGNRIDAVLLRDGGRVSCGAAVNAAGAWAAKIAAMAGIALPVHPKRRTNYFYKCETPLPRCPMVIDQTGLHFRPEGDGYIGGVAPPPAEDHDRWDFEVDYDYFEQRVWPLLVVRVPAFERIKMVRAWSGLFEVNTVDFNAILGPHPEIANFHFANGFSGHGLQQAPAVGRAVSEAILHGAFRTLRLDRFRFDRLLAGQPVRELAVV